MFFNAEFHNDAYFEDTKFHDCVSFDNAIFNKDIILNFERCVLENYINLKVKKCSYINLEESINRDIIDFKPRRNQEVSIEKLNLFNMKNLGHIYIDWDKNNVNSAIEKKFNNKYEYKANQYRMLKENYHQLGEYEQEDKAYVEFKKNKLLADKGNIGYYIKKFLFQTIGDFGTNPKKVACSMFGAIIIFSMLYYLPSIFDYQLIGGNNLGNSYIYSNEIVKSIYYSVVTFLTIGYGDIHPLNLFGMIISGFEGFIGLFLMSYFTVSFVRKVLR
ncbi:potassium channel family protein [Orenia marismortui]|uniref:potassium channel family protein n=1 Tax=Orenia marismortui TaxID=46469 RepID=UPI00036EBDEA|nr:potassium channel family protein [Orenia marismortui]